MGDEARSTSFAFVLPSAERYGPARGGAISTCVRGVVRELVRDGVRTHVLAPRSADAEYAEGEIETLQETGDPQSTVRRLGRALLGRLRPSAWGARARYLSSVDRAVSRTRPAVVVVSNDPDLAAILARGHPETRILLWLHNYLQGREIEALRRVPDSVRMAAVSDSVRTWTLEVAELAPNRVTTIPNGVDHAVFHPDPVRGTTPGPVRIVIPGRIDPNKGQLLGLRAVAEARRRGLPEVEVMIMGDVQTFGHPAGADSRYATEVESEAAALGATILGRVPADEVGRTLRGSEIALVLPLVPEPFGLAALEAMATGVATVAVATGGLAEVLGDGAVLVRPEVDDVASSLGRLVKDERFRAVIAARGVARAAAFSWGSTAEQFAAMARTEATDGAH